MKDKKIVLDILKQMRIHPSDEALKAEMCEVLNSMTELDLSGLERESDCLILQDLKNLGAILKDNSTLIRR